MKKSTIITLLSELQKLAKNTNKRDECDREYEEIIIINPDL